MSISLFNDLVDNIWCKESGAIQKTLVEEFCRTYRKCDSSALLKYQPFINLNTHYILNMGSPLLEDPKYGLYSVNKCLFDTRLIIPLRGFDNNVYGFVGYDNGNQLESEQERSSHIPYLYQSISAFKKDHHWFILPDEYKEAVNSKFICIVDGIFDKISLTSLGLPAVSLLGSSLSYYHREYLRFIPNWVVFSDNDKAGNDLYLKCKQYNNSTIKISTPPNCKDIDEYINTVSGSKAKVLDIITRSKNEGFIFNYNLDATYC